MYLYEFADKINIPFLEQNIREMITFNIPFPWSLLNLLNNKEVRDSVKKLYIANAVHYDTWYSYMKHTVPNPNHYDYYELEYYLLKLYVEKLPRFKELIKR